MASRRSLLITLLFFSSSTYSASLKILIYSGTFDPPHSGHVLTVDHVAKKLGVDETFIITNVSSDHKTGVSDYRIRKELSQLAFSKLDRTSVADPELEQAFLEKDMTGVLDNLRLRFPGAELYLAMGADSYPRFLSSTQNQKIENLTVAVVKRTGVEMPVATHPRTPAIYLDVNAPEISSTAIKNQLVAGDSSIPALPTEVLTYIKTHHLYGYLGLGRCASMIPSLIP